MLSEVKLMVTGTPQACRFLSGGRFQFHPADFFKDAEKLPIVVFERPLFGRRPGGFGGLGPGTGLAHLHDRGRQGLGVEWAVDDNAAIVVHQFRGPVVLGRNHGQAACEGFEDDQGTGVIKGRMDEEVSGEVGVFGIGAESEKPHTTGHTALLSEALVFRKIPMADNRQCEGVIGGQIRQGSDQRGQPLEPIVHPDKQTDRCIAGNIPRCPFAVAALEPIVRVKPSRIDGVGNDANAVSGDAVVVVEVVADHSTVDDDHGPFGIEILLSFEPAERPCGGIKPFGCPGQESFEQPRIFEAIMGNRGNVESALGVENVLTPGLVEADGDIVGRRLQSLFACRGESPRPEKSRPLGWCDSVNMERSGQGGGIPVSGIEVDGMAVACESASQVGDVSLTAATGRDDLFVAEGDVHFRPPSPGV